MRFIKKRYSVIWVVLFFVFFPVLFLSTNWAQAGDQEEIDALVTNYFIFLKEGNLEGILDSITDPIKYEKSMFLKNNPGYSSALVEAYGDKVFNIKKITKIDDQAWTVYAISTSPNQHVTKYEFICRKENGSWKISEEINRF